MTAVKGGRRVAEDPDGVFVITAYESRGTAKKAFVGGNGQNRSEPAKFRPRPTASRMPRLRISFRSLHGSVEAARVF